MNTLSQLRQKTPKVSDIRHTQAVMTLKELWNWTSLTDFLIQPTHLIDEEVETQKKKISQFLQARTSTKVTFIRKICSLTRGVQNSTFARSKNRKEQQNNFTEHLN